jgi:hypothetical protein
MTAPFAWNATAQIARVAIGFIETVSHRQGKCYRSGRAVTGPPGPESFSAPTRCTRYSPNSTTSANSSFQAWMNESYRGSSTYSPRGAVGGVGTDQDRGAVTVDVGDLRERGVEHRDVVSGGVLPALPRRRTAASATATCTSWGRPGTVWVRPLEGTSDSSCPGGRSRWSPGFGVVRRHLRHEWPAG